jgi:hypothetical protein
VRNSEVEQATVMHIAQTCVDCYQTVQLMVVPVQTSGNIFWSSTVSLRVCVTVVWQAVCKAELHPVASAG